MSTLNSWIDPDEISELMPLLLPAKSDKAEEPKPGNVPKRPSPSPGDKAEIGDEPGLPSTTTTTGASQLAETEETGEPTETETEPETEVEPEPEDEREIDFNSPEAYDASAFPEAEGNRSDDALVPVRQAAAVQAAVALERARHRANEGGLIRNAAEDESPADPELAGDPLDGSEPPEETPTASDEPTAAAAGTDDHEDDPLTGSEPAEIEPPEEPGTFRHRLARFARLAAEMTGGSEPVVTDFQSYPLHQPPGDGETRAGAIASILETNRLIGRLPGQQNGRSDKTLQIDLGGGVPWLCVLTQSSASGGVCATLRVPGPVAPEMTGRLHADLRAAVTGVAAE